MEKKKKIKNWKKKKNCVHEKKSLQGPLVLFSHNNSNEKIFRLWGDMGKILQNYHLLYNTHTHTHTHCIIYLRAQRFPSKKHFFYKHSFEGYTLCTRTHEKEIQ